MRRPALRAYVERARNPDVVIIAVTTLLATVPIVWELFRRDVSRRVFVFAASDTYYYLTVARNVAHHGRFSFDGERLTNGFHPLWQALLCVPALVVRVLGADDVWLLVSAVLLGVALLGVAVVALGLALRRDDIGLSPLLLTLPAGVGTAVQYPLMLHWYGGTGRASMTLYSAVNGMETSLVLAAYGLAALSYLKAPRTREGGFLLGVSLSALSFARLDHAAIAATLAASAFLGREHRVFAKSALVTLVSALAIYLAQNRLFFGAALPVSGTIKSTFPAQTLDNVSLIQTILNQPKRLPPGQGHRALALLIPAVFAVGCLLVQAVRAGMKRKRGAGSSSLESRLLACTALGTLAIVSYDYLFVPKMNQGHWYFPVPNLFVSLVVVEGARRWLLRPKGWIVGGIRALVGVASAAASIGVYANGRPSDSDVGYGGFYFDEAPLVRAHYAGKSIKMVEFDDGIVTFSTGIPAMSGTGLTVDAEAVPSAGKGRNAGFGQSRLLDLGISRGFSRFTTLVYQHDRIRPTATDRELRRAYAFLVGRNASGCTLAVDYYSQRSGFAILRADCPPGTPHP